MKILITTDWYAPTVNGVVTSVLNLRRELIRRGHEVRVLTLSQTLHSYESDGVTYIGSVGAGKIYPGARIKAALSSGFVQRLLDWKPDIIHSQCEFSTFLMARRIAKRLSIPIVHTYHTVYEDYTHYFMSNKKWGRQMTSTLSRWVIEQCASVIAPTEKVRAVLSGYGIDRPIHVVPTGIDLGRFTAETSEEKKFDIRKRLDIPDGNRILLYIGRLAKEKNLEELLGYYAKQNTRTLTFLIVGDGPYRDTLEKMALDLGIGDSVRFAGMIPPEQIGDYYHMGDLFVSASVSETQGLTYIEALASGLPALCRRDACLDGVILDGYNGWQYETEREYLADMILLLSDAVIQKIMRKNAAKFAQQAFSAAAFAERAEKVYFETLGEANIEETTVCSEVIPCR